MDQQKIIIDTEDVYFEIPTDYSDISINLAPVNKFDSRMLASQGLQDFAKYSRAGEPDYCVESGFEDKTIELGGGNQWRKFPAIIEDLIQAIDRLEPLYEVVIQWNKIIYLQNNSNSIGDHRRESKTVSTHAMPLKSARKLKAKIKKQLAEQHTTLKIIKSYLLDDRQIAVGMFGKNLEKQLAEIIHKYAKDNKQKAGE